jgi:hypothetical protein
LGSVVDRRSGKELDNLEESYSSIDNGGVFNRGIHISLEVLEKIFLFF